MMEGYGDRNDLAEEEAIITAIPKDKAEDLLEVIRAVTTTIIDVNSRRANEIS
jgi:hypothetical protein